MALPTGTVLLCGAGVSLASGLPDGQRMARLAFDLVADRTTVYAASALAAVHDALRGTGAAEPSLRLELLLDLMARELPADVLAGVYTVVLGAEPSVTHHVLAAAGLPVVTTNQDHLVEDAADRLGRTCQVQHLHGVASRPQSIMTMLSQYVRGLPPDVARRFRELIAGRPVVVIGYSGRDHDVMPYLHAAGTVVWLHHRLGGTPAAHEVQQLQRALGARMRLIELDDPTAWLVDRLPAAAGAGRGVSSTRRVATATLSPAAVEAFRRLPLVDCRLAVARVLVHIGQAAAAHQGLRRTARSHPGDQRVQLRIADALVTMQQHRAARTRYRRTGGADADPVVAASAWLGAAHSAANTSAHRDALEDLDQAASAARAIRDPGARRHVRTRITALRARIAAMTDDEPGALTLYGGLARTAARSHDFDLRVIALLYGADVLRGRGQLRRALHDIGLVFDDNELYGRPHTRVWGRFYRGLVLCALGRTADGLADLTDCRDNAEAGGNGQAVAWAWLALGACLRPADPDAAGRALDTCADVLRGLGGDLLLCEVRLAWERAELDRATGDADGALRRIVMLRERLNGPSFPVLAPYMTPHLLAVEAEVARERGDPAARSMLMRARAGYAEGGWRQGAARIDVSLWLLGGMSRPPRRLLDRCERAGYSGALRTLTGATPVDGYHPIEAM